MKYTVTITDGIWTGTNGFKNDRVIGIDKRTREEAAECVNRYISKYNLSKAVNETSIHGIFYDKDPLIKGNRYITIYTRELYDNGEIEPIEYLVLEQK